MESSSLPALYNRASIIVWVEDLVTSAYLSALWREDTRFHFHVGGGHETLLAVVEDARRAGFSHVFGLRDRDFGSTNRHRWRQPDVTCFALETFEIECFLLDPSALASSVINKQRPKGNAALQDLAKAVAHEQLAAGREPRELMELRDVLLERLASPSPPP